MPAAKTAKPAAAADGSKQPTPQEANLFFAVIKNMMGKPEVDWAAVAVDSGLKNAETAKVRYGQIKRKLGLETWNLPKGKDAKKGDADAEDDGPKTPGSGRGKKTAATPSSAGTGAGVKKRGSASKNSAAAASGGSRARKAKSDAIVKMEDLNQDEDDNDEEENEDEDMLPETPTKKRGSATRVKSEFGGNKSANNRPMATGIDYTNFPAVLPNMVLERKAIYVNLNGTWTLSPVSIQAHAQWVAGLPANIQTQFYAQVTAAGGKNGHSKFIDEDDEEATAGEQFNGAVPVGGALPGAGMNMPMGMGMGYDGAAAPNAGGYHGAQTGKIDLHSIPMHPSYMAQMEKDLREQEERDHATLFGGQNPF
ncbi:hypothetical protein NEMBOFW57_009714 [Staphylotrichum longicolle]|uniref:Myb-like DNA-binding domain-containing protein n=1 Tax=Staphylotrichum longicolle TaxID=669026 RepID=A0AAD4HTJ7_9PEZI|nr:hypothetical protein NEMBOFW57_009714 [Staphylotrichum longicolle]